MSKSIENYNPNLGNVEIVPEVISVIASIAASEVKGVHGMFSDKKNSTLERLGRKNLSKGVKIETSDNEIIINVYCSLKYGVNISDTALKVQESIHNAIKTMTALTPKQVNVHITHIDMGKPKS
ncbi:MULTISPECIES: Asp23/Gls24 family envelope stress response protein [unclassified Staphylococcus]|uniref:Asp23/Gls24 family envelope stress response protein n=1 Tax=unclassified Staphylococcus TaxID=91994 RepID=UPI0021CF576C|nr:MULTISPECIES: Asp23/Gls24 family envelope stress response protein [unclassified Staphylococcus]UXR68691.1 Asp23/Gls24 family envelope stress response protein [Staphylococcus sp. IVB6246]UXR70748.1 Asp23/Gls24 family envelope stress response protein [Staphylococcus sp. IVB6240]UXR72979.1 Asp23/Gls24 family envelope stress response protein [Staphylococcus sp. IVB6238]UXR75274.1 Asp23/Gls24 family envelope stress response protein [Staphylococcus sp. IVB6233]UXR79475.1 Asp23/Gls24 family envelo